MPTEAEGQVQLASEPARKLSRVAYPASERASGRAIVLPLAHTDKQVGAREAKIRMREFVCLLEI